MELDQLKTRLGTLKGDALWRSLDELAQTPEFRESVEREFPASVIQRLGREEDGGESRRNFLKLMGASMALAGVYGCSERPSLKILPYVRQPEQIVPGMPIMFASTMPLNGYGLGVLGVSHEGRPTKIEGNPEHPASLGGTNIFMQASVLQLYDPERSHNLTRAGVISSWDVFSNALHARLDQKREAGGDKVRLLTGTVTSPTLAWQIQEFLRQFPQARWHVHDPMARANTQQGAQMAFGRPVACRYVFRSEEGKPQGRTEAKVILSLDSDFLWSEPGSVRYAREFAEARKIRVRHAWKTDMNRLYVVESGFSLTGAMADHRVPAAPTQVAEFARAVAARLGVAVGEGGAAPVPPSWQRIIDALVNDLQQNRGASLVAVGESMPPEIHALGHAMNAALENVGKTVVYMEPIEVIPRGANGQPATAFESLRELTEDMNAGRVDTLLILGENPAYTAPGDVGFADALLRLSRPQYENSTEFVNFTAHLGLYDDETSFRCQWHLPESHYLESWGDVRAFDGTASLIQPLIGPLFEGRSAIEVMDIVLTPPGQYRTRTGYEIVREYWRPRIKGDLEHWWRQTLVWGIVEGSASKPLEGLTPRPPGRANEPPASQPTSRPAAATLELVFRPDPSVWDGSFANNGWLQETPKFFTKLVWDNAALISPRTADALRRQFNVELADGHFLNIKNGKLSLDAPVMILPGIPDNSIVVSFGYGRTRGGTSAAEPDGKPRGYDAYAIRNWQSPWSAERVEVRPLERFRQLVTTRNHHAMDTMPFWGRKDIKGPLKPHAIIHPEPEKEGRSLTIEEEQRETENRRLVRTTTLEWFNAAPDHRHFVKELGGEAEKKPLLDIYPGWDYSKGYQWGMSIDMQSCIGCNACLVACVAENNIAVVGRDEVARQREMHWIRIDQYFASSLNEEQLEHVTDPLEAIANPRVYNQPVPCMQCENAPCELVCPVGATTHSAEGLNQMTYNRCVGTRYCSNNCPYKVRRFNFFNWFKGSDPTFDLQHNPQVTVRVRGVMEKCTYCVQRLNRTRIEIEKMIVRTEEEIEKLQKEQAQTPGADLKPEIQRLKSRRHNDEFSALEKLQTACQQACPTEAIAFGSILPVLTVDSQSREVRTLTHVTKLKQEPLDYPLLAELTTKPRTTYMARLRNPNPQLEPDAKA